MSNRRWILCLTVLASLLTTAASAVRAQQSRTPDQTEEFHQTYPLAADGRVSISNINGGVKISAWDRNEVRVDAVKRAYKQERLREAEIRVSADGSRLHIKTEYPERTWRGNHEREDQPASVEYTLSVPRHARLEDVKLVNGSLDIEGVAGAVDGSSVNGKLTARGLTGKVNLSVVNGRLEATFDRLAQGGSVSLSAVNGPLVVTIPSDSNAHLRASTVHGGIRNDFNLPVRAGEYVGHNLEGRLGSGGARINASNVNGSIQLRRANDNRTLSPATNLLSETRSRSDYKEDNDNDNDNDNDSDSVDEKEIAREAREAAREAREAVRQGERENRVERERERLEAQREAREIAREAQREVRESLKDHNLAVRDHSRRQIERETKTLAVSGAPRIRVETFDGSINIHAWDKPEVAYTAIKRAVDEREMRGIRIVSTGGGSEVVVRAEFDKSQSRDYVEKSGHVVSFNSGASVEFDVFVPRSSTLFVSSGDGRLRVEGVSGELTLNTGDGAIDVSGGGGRLRVETGDGGIRVENFDGEADARTGDGRITLDGRFQKLAARTGDGTITLSLPSDLSATIETDAESVVNDGLAASEDSAEGRLRRWRVGSGGQVFTLRTGDGHVILRRR